MQDDTEDDGAGHGRHHRVAARQLLVQNDHGKHDAGEPAGPEPLLYFRVASIQSAYDTLAGRGVTFDGEPLVAHRTENEELWLAGFKDSEGNRLLLMSEVAL